MRTLDRYIATLFLKTLFFSIMALTGLFLFQKFMGEMLDHQFPLRQVLFYDLMSVPEIIVQMVPPSVLVATVLTLSGMSRSNELVACYSIGVGSKQIIAVLLAIVFMVSCLNVVMQDRILPPLYRKRVSYYWREMKNRADFFLDFKQNKIWYRSKNLIYNLRTFDPKSNTIYGMSVYNFDESFNLLQVVDAERADFTPTGWKLKDGTVTVFSKGEPFPLNRRFQEKELVINESPTDFKEIEKEVDGLRLMELYRYIKKTREVGADTKNYEVKLHSRISLSFIPVIMCTLGFPFSLRTRREGGMAKDLGICLGVTFFYWLFYSVGLSLGTNGSLPPWLAAWLPSAVFGIVAGVLVTRRAV